MVDVIDDFKANFKTWGDEQRLEWDNIEATILELEATTYETHLFLLGQREENMEANEKVSV